jgi:fucose permease
MGDPAGLFRRSADSRLFIGLLLNFTVFGTTVTIIGATVPSIIGGFGYGYSAMGLVLSSAPAGYLLSTLVSGLMVKRLGPKRVILLGLLLQGLGLAFFGAGQGLLLNFSMALLMGLGQGSTEVVTNFCVARMEHPGRSRLMNLIHAAFPLGAISGPLAMGGLLASGQAWQLTYRGLAALTFLFAGSLSFFSFRSMEPDDEPSPRGVRLVVRSRLLILLSLVMLLFVGSELGASAWVSEYFVEVFGSSASLGAWMVSVFWSGALLGRLFMSFYYRGTRQADILFSTGCLSTLAISLFISMGTMMSAALAFFLTGLCYSAAYPIVMSLVGHNCTRDRGTAIGVVASAGGIGSFSFPLIMSAAAGGLGIQGTFWICVVATCAGTALAWPVRRLCQR